MPATTFIGHFLGPDTHSNRPAATGLPNGTLYVCTTHGKIERVLSGAWADYATLGGGATDPVFDAKGDLLVASGPDSASRLPVGTDTQVLTANAAASLGVSWVTPPAGGSVLFGTGTPSAGTGTTGDAYINTTSGGLYQKAFVAPTTTLGQTTISGEAVQSISADEMWLNRYTLSTAFTTPTFTKLRIKLSGFDGEFARLVLYASDGASNAPGTKLAEHEFVTAGGGAAAVYEYTVPGTVAAPNDDYYIGFHNKAVGNKYWAKSSGGPVRLRSVAYGTSSPDPAGTFGAEFTSLLFSAQAVISGAAAAAWQLVGTLTLP